MWQTHHLRFPFSFSYQHPYPDRLKTYFIECQRTNSCCTQAERSRVPNVQLLVSRRALHQIGHFWPEVPGILMANSVLSLILLSALEGAWWFHHSSQEEGWVHWAHSDVFLGTSAVFTLHICWCWGINRNFSVSCTKLFCFHCPYVLKESNILSNKFCKLLKFNLIQVWKRCVGLLNTFGPDSTNFYPWPLWQFCLLSHFSVYPPSPCAITSAPSFCMSCVHLDGGSITITAVVFKVY